MHAMSVWGVGHNEGRWKGRRPAEAGKGYNFKYVTSFVRILAQGGRMFQCAHQQALCARVAEVHLQGAPAARSQVAKVSQIEGTTVKWMNSQHKNCLTPNRPDATNLHVVPHNRRNGLKTVVVRILRVAKRRRRKVNLPVVYVLECSMLGDPRIKQICGVNTTPPLPHCDVQ